MANVVVPWQLEGLTAVFVAAGAVLVVKEALERNSQSAASAFRLGRESMQIKPVRD